MSEFSMVVKLGEDALKVPGVRRVVEEATTAAGRMLEDIMPKSVISGAENFVEEVAALPRYGRFQDRAEPAFRDRFNPFASVSEHQNDPAQKLIDKATKDKTVFSRETSGTPEILFGKDGAVQHVLFNKDMTAIERTDHWLAAGFANLIHEDQRAAEAAGKVMRQTAGFISRPTERWATEEEMQQNAISGANAYIRREAASYNGFTNYLTDRFGHMTQAKLDETRDVLSNGWAITPEREAHNRALRERVRNELEKL